MAEEKTDPVQENFLLPREVWDEIRPVIVRHGVKRKWQVYTAAILLLLE